MDQLWIDNQGSSSWALFHSQVKTLKPPLHQDLSVVLPLRRDDSKSPARIKHFLNYLNPGQAAVVVLDQPLFAIAKRIQWFSPNEYGQNKVVFMLSALHIEMVMLSYIGDLLEDNDWTVGLCNAGITTLGNDVLVTGDAVANSKYMRQVTARALLCTKLP